MLAGSRAARYRSFRSVVRLRAERPTDVMRDLQDDLSKRALVHLTVAQSSCELNFEEVLVSLRGENANSDEAPGGDVQARPAPHVPEKMVDRVRDEVPRACSGSALNPYTSCIFAMPASRSAEGGRRPTASGSLKVRLRRPIRCSTRRARSAGTPTRAPTRDPARRRGPCGPTQRPTAWRRPVAHRRPVRRAPPCP